MGLNPGRPRTKGQGGTLHYLLLFIVSLVKPKNSFYSEILSILVLTITQRIAKSHHLKLPHQDHIASIALKNNCIQRKILPEYIFS